MGAWACACFSPDAGVPPTFPWRGHLLPGTCGRSCRQARAPPACAWSERGTGPCQAEAEKPRQGSSGLELTSPPESWNRTTCAQCCRRTLDGFQVRYAHVRTYVRAACMRGQLRSVPSPLGCRLSWGPSACFVCLS